MAGYYNPTPGYAGSNGIPMNNMGPVNLYPYQSPEQRLQNYEQQMMNYQQQQASNQNNQPAGLNNIIYVEGIEGAKSYRPPPNSNVLLLDPENRRLYWKRTDSFCAPNMRIYAIQDITDMPQQPVTQQIAGDFVPRQEFDSLKTDLYNQIEQQKAVINTLSMMLQNTQVIQPVLPQNPVPAPVAQNAPEQSTPPQKTTTTRGGSKQ